MLSKVPNLFKVPHGRHWQKTILVAILRRHFVAPGIW